MADIVFRYGEMRNAVENIRSISSQYKATASTFQNDFTGAVSTWEGESGEKMKAFINGPVMEYIGTSVPQLLDALAELLAANADQMEKADQQIAENIPSSLG